MTLILMPEKVLKAQVSSTLVAINLLALVSPIPDVVTQYKCVKMMPWTYSYIL